MAVINLTGQDGIADGSHILARSPVTLSVTDGTMAASFRALGSFDIFIWTGSKASKPASANYTLTTYGATPEQFFRPTWTIDAGDYIRDFIKTEVGYNDTPSGTTPAVWVAYEFLASDALNSYTYTSPTAAAFLGYVNYQEGWSGSERFVTDFLQSHPDHVYFSDNLDYILRASRLGYSGGTAINVAEFSFTNQRTNNTYTSSNSPNTISTGLTKNNSWGVTLMASLSVPVSEYYDTFSYKVVYNISGGGTADGVERLITMTEQCRQPDGKLSFFNQKGTLQDVILRGRIDKTKNVERTVYNDAGVYDPWQLSYASTRHMDATLRAQGNYTFAVNTDWIDASHNTAIEEMLLSERVWLTDTDGTVYPVVIQDVQDKEFNSYWDKQVNKTFILKAATPIINNIGV